MSNAIEEVLLRLADLLQPTVKTPPSRVSWNGLSKLDLTKFDDLDSWFMAFEGRLNTARVDPDEWNTRFFECPSVDESLKVRLQDMVFMPYEDIRRHILKTYGPVQPVNYFKRELYRVRGTDKEAIRETLIQLLTKHNRAAKDHDKPQMDEEDLCYPFLEAFPAHVRGALEQQLHLICEQSNPFEHLFRSAPAKEQVANETSFNALTEVAAHPAKRGREEVSTPAPVVDAQALTLALQVLEANGFSKNPPKRRRGQFVPNNRPKPSRSKQETCVWCGGPRHQREECPANGAQCLKCSKTGHFAAVCKARTVPFQARLLSKP